MSAQVDETTVRQFIEIISAHARQVINAAGPPGVLQLSRLNPLDTNPIPSRFTLDDIENMVKTAVGDALADRGLHHVLDVVEREATRDRIGVEWVEPAQLQDARRAGGVDHLAGVRADDLDELANGRFVHLRAHMIFPPSWRNREKRYLCMRSVGSRSYTVFDATLSMNS